MAEIKDFKLKIKSLSQDGRFEGWLATYGNVDEQGEAVMAGAFTKSLNDNGAEIPLLWQHRYDEPIGLLRLEDRPPKGLFVKGELLIEEVSRAKEAYALLKRRIVKGLSIGFKTIRDKWEKNVRLLLELRLMEGSLVSFPANTEAEVTAVKAETRQAEIAALSEILRAADAALHTMRTRR